MSSFRDKKCTCLFPHPHWMEGHFLHRESETYRIHGKQIPECSVSCPIHDKKNKIKKILITNEQYTK